MIRKLTRKLSGFFARQKKWNKIMGSFGTTEIILIVAVLFLLFGASRLPQLAKSFGQTRKAFKDGMREAEEEERTEAEKRKQIASNPNAPQINATKI
jgi:sec-independent protein translocase protein TatA